MAWGVEILSLFPINAFMIGRTYRQPEVVFISLPQVATGLRYACRARSVGGHVMQTTCVEQSFADSGLADG